MNKKKTFYLMKLRTLKVRRNFVPLDFRHMIYPFWVRWNPPTPPHPHPQNTQNYTKTTQTVPQNTF